MRKLIIILLAILFAFSAAAESDMAGVPTEDLITLRDALINLANKYCIFVTDVI